MSLVDLWESRYRRHALAYDVAEANEDHVLAHKHAGWCREYAERIAELEGGEWDRLLTMWEWRVNNAA